MQPRRPFATPGPLVTGLLVLLLGAAPGARAQEAAVSADTAAAVGTTGAAEAAAAPADSLTVLPGPPEAAAAPGLPPATGARAEKKVRLSRSDRNVARTGPGGNFSLAGVYERDAVFTVIAKSGEWYNVRLSATRTGWFHASLCEEFDDLTVLEFRPNPRLYSRVGSFVLTAQMAGYSFDRKSNSLAYGARLGYYLFDWMQVEGALSYTHVVRPQEIVESLFNLRLEEERFHMLFYEMNVTVELLPGRQMVPFLTGGAGSTILKGKAEPSFDLGVGTMLYTGKTAAMRWELRNHRFPNGSEAARRTSSNFEFIMGFSILR